MPEVYDDRRLTLVFAEERDGIQEIEVIKSIMSKVSSISKEAGYKRKFTATETEMIRGLDNYINKRNTKIDEK